jgi:Mn2+/Fe2+ NRAMP family transporter
MGQLVSPLWLKWLSWTAAVAIAGLNAWLLVLLLRGQA